MKRISRRFLVAVLGIALLMIASHGGAVEPLDTGSLPRESLRSYFGSHGERHYDIKFQDANLRDALQFLSWIANANIMIPEGVDGVVSVSFRDIALGDAINSIIKANGLDYTVEGGVIRIGKGETFKDSGEDLRTETFRLNFATARNMVDQVKSLLSVRGSVFADDRTNSLVVRELPANIDNVRRFLDGVDIRDAQVLIEAKILEATRNFSRALGIQWGINKPGGRWDLQGLSTVGQAQGGAGHNLNTNFGVPSPTSGLGLVIGRLAGGTNIDVQISAAETRGDAYVISDPSIVTSNGTAAKIRSGTTLLINAAGNITIGGGAPSGSGGTNASGGAGLQQIQTGVELNVTPQISINEYVKLDIQATTSSPDFSRAVNGIPVIVDNTAKTTVLVRDGETTVIGGLTRFANSNQEKRVPGLSRVPLLGGLFKSKTKAKDNSELMVFIKPSIVRGEGTLPAQMRVREVEEQRETMYLEPMTTPDKENEKKEAKARRQRAAGGNKYQRDRGK